MAGVDFSLTGGGRRAYLLGMRTKLTKTQKALLASLDRPRTARELAELTETSRLYTTRALTELVELGLVARTPPTVIYTLAAEAAAT